MIEALRMMPVHQCESRQKNVAVCFIAQRFMQNASFLEAGIVNAVTDSNVADIALQPSLRGVQWVFWLHVIPACLLPLATSEKFYAVPLVLLLFASWMQLRRHPVLGFGPRAITHLIARADGSWRIETAAGGGEDVSLQPDSIVTGWLLVLSFRNAEGRRRSRLIFGGEADEGALRRLRVSLNTQKRASGDGAASGG
jgi:hypothetical protein